MPAKKKGGAGKGRRKKRKKKSAKAALARETAMVKLKSFFKTYSANCAGGFPSSKIVKACREAVEDKKALSTALFLESINGVNLKVLELRDSHLSSWSIRRLAKPLVQLGITSLNLDYNRIYPDALLELCEKLQLNTHVRTLSLNYCHLDPACGEILGNMASTSQIRNLSVVGNSIQCQGLVELMKPLVSLYEPAAATSPDSGEHSEEVETTVSMVGMSPPHTPASEKSAEGEQEKQGEDILEDRESPKLPVVQLIPALAKLDIRDNSIDSYSICEEEKVLTFELIVCMRAVKRLIISSHILEEINLDHNLIGDGGARELLQGLQQRKDVGLPPMKLTVTSIQISSDTFQKLIELGSPPKKKKGKGKRKKVCLHE